jgi:flagellar biosynthesis/type III secretory pathway M-ring protein FliF/YscJ
MVEDADIARKMRVILIREDLIPKGTAPWRIFDFEWNVYSLRAQTQMVKDHIMALGGVDDADVSIIIPKDTLFTENQNPVSASVIIFPTPGSDITKSRKKIEGIQKIVKFAVEGLKDENIVIVDQTGLVINDFEYLKEIDEQNRIERRQKFIQKMEGEYRAKILEHFQSTFSPDRIRNLDVKFEIDWSNIASLKIARKTVFVNIDGIWRIKYNEKGKPVLLADGSIEREYIPIPPQDLHAIKSLIQDIIGYNELKGDSVTVTNIAFDRVNEFKIEDSKYFRQEIFKYIFLLIIPLMIIILIVIIIKKNIMGAKGTKSSN